MSEFSRDVHGLSEGTIEWIAMDARARSLGRFRDQLL